ncbi:MAG: ribosomal protein L13e, partial [Spirochaetota bacterium]|nr:ribosomal protein L13e [Spirochaetota bacterium]
WNLQYKNMEYKMKQVLNRLKVSVKKKSGTRKGRGFSLKELSEAKVSVIEAKLQKIPVDPRRKSCHTANIESIKILKK